MYKLSWHYEPQSRLLLLRFDTFSSLDWTKQFNVEVLPFHKQPGTDLLHAE